MNKRQRKKAEKKLVVPGARITPGEVLYIACRIKEFNRVMKKLCAKSIMYSCGFCGAPLNADKNQVDAPDGYAPNAYPHDVCGRCQAEHEYHERMIVTREMALDAGDPSLEGLVW